MFPSNLHTHTIYSDGASTAEEYIKKAINLGFTSIGFSEHSSTVYQCSAEILPQNIDSYISEINQLKEKYKNQIEILLGFEEDIYGPVDRSSLDFVIGAVHYLQTPQNKNKYISVDHNPGYFEELIQAFGSIENVCKEYYRMVSQVIATKPDILAHFDLLTKFNGDVENHYFDPHADWYKNLVNNVCDDLKNTGIIVEINTGAISRGYRTTPYPSDYILKKLHQNQIPITISADAHQDLHINFAFDQAIHIAKNIGYTSVKLWKNGGFIDYNL